MLLKNLHHIWLNELYLVDMDLGKYRVQTLDHCPILDNLRLDHLHSSMKPFGGKKPFTVRAGGLSVDSTNIYDIGW